MQQARNENRRHVRHPIRLPAQLLHEGATGPGCTIEDFSLAGMAVTVTAQAAAERPAPRGLRHDGVVTIAFNLPEDGRTVRARALLKHLHRDGETIRLGLSFRKTHPLIMDCLLKESLLSHWGGPAAQTETGESPSTESIPPPAAPVAAEPADEVGVDTIDLDAVLPVVCERFFRDAKERLMERFHGDGEYADAYFRGVVALQGEQERMEQRLRACATPTRDGLNGWFAKLVKTLEVSDGVRDELCNLFSDTLDAEQLDD